MEEAEEKGEDAVGHCSGWTDAHQWKNMADAYYYYYYYYYCPTPF